MTTREVQPELMDDARLDAGEHRRALAGLERLNRLSGSARLVWSALADLVPDPDGEPLRVLDVATGGGDVPATVARRAAASASSFEVHGCDVSPTAVAKAAARADAVGARFFRLDALGDPLPPDYDVIVCSLFLHHLSERDAVTLLRKMAAAARRRVVVNDLERARANLALVSIAARLVTRSRVVHVDAARSVRAAFTLDEMRSLADRAGLAGVSIERRFPCRLLLVWDRR